MRHLLLVPLLLLLLVPSVLPAAEAEDEPSPDVPAPPEPSRSPPWFRNVAKETGLAEVRAKDCIFTDLNADGFWDLCLDRQHLYLSLAGGSFKLHETAGIVFPEITRTPLGKGGQPDTEKARTGPYKPHYLYFADVNNDGHQDAILGVHSWWAYFDGSVWKNVAACDPGVRSQVWLGDAEAHFTLAPASAFSAKDAAGPAMALAMLDYDGDGLLDLYEGREYRQYGVLQGCGVDRLWRGDGAGGFSDVTEAAGLLTVPEPAGPRSSRPSYGVTHADWNGDGWVDLLQLSYGRQWNYLWKNNGDGTFTDVGRETMFAGDAITHGRYPDWLQAYMAERGRPPRPDEKPFRSNGNTFDCAVGDVDNDGDLDLFLGEICHEWAGEASDLPSLLINQGEAGGWQFERKTVRAFLPARTFRPGSRWNYGDLHTAFFDADNDGLLDLLIGSGDYPDGQYLRLYRQREDGHFEEVTRIAGFDWEGCGDISLGDFDRDGDVDILAGRSFMRLNQAHRDKHMGGLKAPVVGLFRNEVCNRNGNHWVNVRLRGKGKAGGNGSNRSGIGARIRVTTGTRTQLREIRAGSGLSNHEDPPEACFGLGQAETIDRLEVRWPDAAHTVQVFQNVPVDRFLVIAEGASTLEVSKR